MSVTPVPTNESNLWFCRDCPLRLSRIYNDCYFIKKEMKNWDGQGVFVIKYVEIKVMIDVRKGIKFFLMSGQ